MARYPTRGRGNRTNVLSKEHKDLLLEWFSEGLSTHTVRDRMAMWNNTCVASGKQPFPDICLATITYHRRKMQSLIEKAVEEQLTVEELVVRRGLRNREERIKRLEQAAEALEPYLGQANVKGLFSASEQYVNVLRAIRDETDPRGFASGSKLDPNVIRSLPLDMVKKLAQEYAVGSPA
jgi:hypothetical protein